MECTWPASCDLQEKVKEELQEKVKEELVRGYDLANQLRLIVGNGDGGSAKGVAKKIECSFTTILSLLSGNHESKGKHIQVNPSSSTIALPTIVDSSSSWYALEPIKSTELFMGSNSTSIKRKASHSWSRDAPDFIDDGHVWRKYGQKQILNASHPRSYFRCSHKYDQGCKATKQVQKVEDDPTLFRTTYFGNHTCKHSLLKAPELILDNICDDIPREESASMFMISFNNSIPYQQEHPFFSSHTSTAREIIKSDHVASSQSSSSRSCDYLVQRDQLMVFESSEPISSWLPTMMEPDYEDMNYYNAMMEYLEQEILPM